MTRQSRGATAPNQRVTTTTLIYHGGCYVSYVTRAHPFAHRAVISIREPDLIYVVDRNSGDAWKRVDA